MKTYTYIVNETYLQILQEYKNFIKADTPNSGVRLVGIINYIPVVCMPQADKMYLLIKEIDDEWYKLPIKYYER